ncbi:MAG: SDR family oxidoreductase [Desulfosalsimonadaceae bacterium]
MKILITGATGFIGSKLLQILEARAEKLCALVRRKPCRQKGLEGVNWIEYDITGSMKELPEKIADIDIVVHLAARAHVMDDKLLDPLTKYRKVNVQGSLNLAQQAAAAGIKRFVFISSIGVNGNQSIGPFTVNDPPNPIEPYAISKFEAEQSLRKFANETRMELVVIRPPLVYGPMASGNFRRLVRLVHKGLPLPLGLVHNKRSLVALDNLVDLILTCIDHPDAAGQTFMVSDGKDLSTPELIRKLAYAMGRPTRLLPVPQGLLRLGGFMMGKEKEVERLIGSLQVDISHTCDTLGWRPPVTADEALYKTGRDFVSRLKED